MEIWFLMALMVTAAGWDLRTRKIPNLLILFGALPGILIQLFNGGVGDLPLLAWRIIWPMLLLIGIWWIRGIGAGDVKLFMLASIYLTAEEELWLIGLSFVFGAGFSLYRMLKRKEFLARIWNFGTYVSACISRRTLTEYESLEEGSKIHFSVFILLGLIVLTIWEVIVCGRQMF